MRTIHGSFVFFSKTWYDGKRCTNTSSNTHMANADSSPSIPVVIFCGGKGTRLKEETDFKPKPMVTVGGMPILWHIMKIYAAHGFTRFVLCLGYKSGAIKEFFFHRRLWENDIRISLNADGVKHLNDRTEDWEVTLVETGLETLTGERLLKAKAYIPEDRFMVTYGDGVGTIDIKALLNFHEQEKVVGTITGVHPYSKWGLVETDEENRVKLFRQKPHLNEYVNGGFMVFEREFFDTLKVGGTIEEGLVALTENRELALFRHENFWHAMDTYQDMEYLNKLWDEGAPWKNWE